uniref:Uncharacterized protein n=1 Tax=Arundo donax TaxID=35708 RepID=A0A0A9ET68_ARUDO
MTPSTALPPAPLAAIRVATLHSSAWVLVDVKASWCCTPSSCCSLTLLLCCFILVWKSTGELSRCPWVSVWFCVEVVELVLCKLWSPVGFGSSIAWSIVSL